MREKVINNVPKGLTHVITISECLSMNKPEISDTA